MLESSLGFSRPAAWMTDSYSRLLPTLHVVIKMAIFSIFFEKFFDHMFTYALKIFQKICLKIAYFSNQSEFRKKSSVVWAGTLKYTVYAQALKMATEQCLAKGK